MKKILLGKEARDKIMEGVDAVGDALARTLGPNGRNAIYGDRFRTPTITNDGVSIAKEIELDDDCANLGAKAMIEVCQKTNDRAGDGTTTSAVIAHALCKTAKNLIDGESGIIVKNANNPLELRAKIETERSIIEQEINKRARKLKKGELSVIGRVSMESETLGNLVAEVVSKVGSQGTVHVEEADQKDITVEYKDGIEINHGLLTELLANQTDNSYAGTNPRVLVTNYRMTSTAPIAGVISGLIEENGDCKDFIVVAPEFDPVFVQHCIQNKSVGLINIIPVRYQESYQRTLADDIAAKVGAKFIMREVDTLDSIQTKDFGVCEQVVIDSDTTKFIGAKSDVAKQVDKIKLVRPKSEFEKQEQDDRIAALTGSVAIIKVGGKTAQERSYIKLKIDDAVCACRMAVKGGVVRGGGLCLYELADKVQILSDALRAPHEQIKRNGTKEIPEWVYDPAESVKVGLENAVSVASLLLTTDILIAETDDSDKDQKR
jgi:chaperonin GroEL